MQDKHLGEREGGREETSEWGTNIGGREKEGGEWEMSLREEVVIDGQEERIKETERQQFS